MCVRVCVCAKRGGSLGSIVWGVREPALVLFLFYVNVSGMRLSYQPLKIPAPWVFLQVGWSIPLVPSWVTASYFLAGNRNVELNLTTFSSFLLFRVFLSSPFSWPSNDVVSLSAACYVYVYIQYIFLPQSRTSGCWTKDRRFIFFFYRLPDDKTVIYC